MIFFAEATKIKLIPLVLRLKRHLERSNALLKHGLILFAAGLVGNILNYFYQFAMGRMLGPEHYGVLATLISLTYILTIPAQTVQTFTAKLVSKQHVTGHPDVLSYFIRRLLTKAALGGLVGAGLLMSASVPIARFLRISSAAPVVMLAAVFLFQLLAPVLNGGLLGLQRFSHFSWVQIANYFTKLVLGVALAALGLGVNGAMAGLVLGAAIGVWLGLCFLRDVIMVVPIKARLPKMMSALGCTLLAFLFLTLISNADVILVRRFFTDVEAGYYGAASTIAKTVLFASVAIAGAMFPKVVARGEEGNSIVIKQLLRDALVYTGLLAGFGALVLNLFPTFVVSLLFGSEYSESARLVGLLSWAMFFLGLSSVAVMYQMAIGVYRFIFVLAAGFVAQCVGIVIFHGSLQCAAWVMITVTFLVLGGTTILAWGKAAALAKRVGPILGLVFNWRDTKNYYTGGIETRAHTGKFLDGFWKHIKQTMQKCCGKDFTSLRHGQEADTNHLSSSNAEDRLQNGAYRIKVALISPFPLEGSKHVSSGGVPSYTKNLAEGLFKAGVELIVFADKQPEKGVAAVDKGDITVVRCWSKGWLYPLRLFAALHRYRRRFDIVHIQHEYFLFGGAVAAAMFPLLPALIRIVLRKPVVVTMHGVIPCARIDRVFLRENKIRGPIPILRFGLKYITKLIGAFSNGIVVHEKHFAEVLSFDYGICSRKVAVIPHGVEEIEYSVSPEEARRRLNVEEGKKILLFFGYLSGYKGLETLIEAYAQLNPQEKYILIVAGGEHPRYRDDPNYQRWIATLKDKAKTISQGIRFTGFVPEEEIPVYFGAADLVILPYTQAFASSGPMNLAIAYNKPVLVSTNMARTLGIDVLHAEPDAESLAKAITAFFADEGLRTHAYAITRSLKLERSWMRVSKKTAELYRCTLRQRSK